jgi:hypothetical protein
MQPGPPQSRSQSMPVRGLCSGITHEEAYSGNEIESTGKIIDALLTAVSAV